MNDLIHPFIWALQRDIQLAARHKTELLTALFFFVIVVNLLPLGVGPDPSLLKKIAPGTLWIGALLSTLLGLQRLFGQDFHDGTLEPFLLAPYPLPILLSGKIWAQWLVSSLPIILVAPVLGLQFDLGTRSLLILMASLLLGTPTLTFIGAVGAALTLGIRGGGVLLSLLILPLYIPVLIFGAGAVEADLSGISASGHFYLLGALLMISLFLAPWATAVALRLAMEH